MLEIKSTETDFRPNIVVIGAGGGGNNAINRMNTELHQENVRYIAVNTDMQVLSSCNADLTLQIGKKLTGGYGAGADPSVGEAAAKENSEEILDAVKDAKLAILTCGMGGGTGTGAIPVIANICREAGILTVGVVTLPFTFESRPRVLAAEQGVKELEKYTDTLLIIPNDKLLTITDKPFFLEDAFTFADKILRDTIFGITNIINNKGMINLDFNDIKTTLSNKGIGHLGIGTTESESIMDAVKLALDSPLLDTNIAGATNILINSSGKINIIELNQAISYVRDIAGPDTNIIWGTVTNPDFDMEKITVTLIATGMNETAPKKMSAAPLKPVSPSGSKPIITPHNDIPLVIPTFLDRKR